MVAYCGSRVRLRLAGGHARLVGKMHPRLGPVACTQIWGTITVLEDWKEYVQGQYFTYLPCPRADRGFAPCAAPQPSLYIRYDMAVLMNAAHSSVSCLHCVSRVAAASEEAQGDWPSTSVRGGLSHECAHWHGVFLLLSLPRRLLMWPSVALLCTLLDPLSCPAVSDGPEWQPLCRGALATHGLLC